MESDFSVLGWERDDYRTGLTDSSLEEILFRKQYPALKELKASLAAYVQCIPLNSLNKTRFRPLRWPLGHLGQSPNFMRPAPNPSPTRQHVRRPLINIITSRTLK